MWLRQLQNFNGSFTVASVVIAATSVLTLGEADSTCLRQLQRVCGSFNAAVTALTLQRDGHRCYLRITVAEADSKLLRQLPTLLW